MSDPRISVLVAIKEGRQKGHHIKCSPVWHERQIGHVKAMPHANGQTREPPPAETPERLADSRFSLHSVSIEWAQFCAQLNKMMKLNILAKIFPLAENFSYLSKHVSIACCCPL